MTFFPQAFEAILFRIEGALRRSGRPPHTVKLVGVSKGQEASVIEQATQSGLWDFGENYVQEWLQKKKFLASTYPELPSQIRWHFIGHLQSNKAQEVVGEVDYLHSIDSVKIARKVSEVAGQKGLRQKVLLEINVGTEPNKYGFQPSHLKNALADLAALPHLSLEGLMGIPPNVEDAKTSRPYFAQLKSLLDECNRSGVISQPMKELSMGMSHDFEVAIEAGATMVRIGTALFGARS